MRRCCPLQASYPQASRAGRFPPHHISGLRTPRRVACSLQTQKSRNTKPGLHQCWGRQSTRCTSSSNFIGKLPGHQSGDRYTSVKSVVGIDDGILARYFRLVTASHRHCSSVASDHNLPGHSSQCPLPGTSVTITLPSLSSRLARLPSLLKSVVCWTASMNASSRFMISSEHAMRVDAS